MAIGINPQGVPQLKLTETGGWGWSWPRKRGDLEWLRGTEPEPGPDGASDDVVEARRVYGTGETIRLSPDEFRLPLVRVWRRSRGPDHRPGTADDHTTGEGLLVWIERVPGDDS